MEQLEIFTDGGSRGNPGHAGIGFYAKYSSGEEKYKKYIGLATNNQAEYQAVIAALEWVSAKFSKAKIDFFLDSQLVVEQLNGNYKLKNEGLKPLFWQIRDLILKIGGQVSFTHVRREKNKVADSLVNKAIDEALERSADGI